MKLGEIRKIDSCVLPGDDLVFKARVMCDCGREWWEGDRFCPRCGRKLPENHPGVIEATVKPDEVARIGEARIREKFAQLRLGGGSAEGGATTEGKRKIKAWTAMYRTGRDGSWHSGP